MLVSIWSPKGGSGTSVVAAVVAAVVAKAHPDVRLVDLAGDQPAVCGVRLSARLGARALFDAESDVEVRDGALDALTVEIDEGFRMVPAGRASLDHASADRGAVVARALRHALPLYVVDAGCVAAPGVASLVRASDLALMVIRPCFLALHRASALVDLVERSTGIVCVSEPGRALSVRDVSSVLGRPVLCEVDIDPDVARSVDAGVLLRREPHAVFVPITRMCRRLGLSMRDENVA